MNDNKWSSESSFQGYDNQNLTTGMDSGLDIKAPSWIIVASDDLFSSYIDMHIYYGAFSPAYKLKNGSPCEIIDFSSTRQINGKRFHSFKDYNTLIGDMVIAVPVGSHAPKLKDYMVNNNKFISKVILIKIIKNNCMLRVVEELVFFNATITSMKKIKEVIIFSFKFTKSRESFFHYSQSGFKLGVDAVTYDLNSLTNPSISNSACQIK